MEEQGQKTVEIIIHVKLKSALVNKLGEDSIHDEHT